VGEPFVAGAATNLIEAEGKRCCETAAAAHRRRLVPSRWPLPSSIVCRRLGPGLATKKKITKFFGRNMHETLNIDKK
jgi:hypothetical protein